MTTPDSLARQFVAAGGKRVGAAGENHNGRHGRREREAIGRRLQRNRTGGGGNGRLDTLESA